MSGLFDKLQNELDSREEEGGISPLDLAELPSKLRKLMRHMLREVEAPFERIAELAAEFDEKDRMDEAELKEALEELGKLGWVITFGEGDKITYKVNLRRKRGSQLAASIWSALDNKIEEHARTKKPKEDE